MVGVSSHYRDERVSGLVDCVADCRGAVLSPVHREHERVWHGGRANVGNVSREIGLFSAAPEVYAGAGLLLGPVLLYDDRANNGSDSNIFIQALRPFATKCAIPANFRKPMEMIQFTVSTPKRISK